MAEYYMILTLAGQAAYAQAGAGGGAVQISAVAIGDGGGVAVQPAESWTALAREVWRSAPALVEVDADNPRLVLTEAHVPYDVGGWYVREVGLLSPEGVLLAVGNYPESYKPALESSGVGKELMIRVYMEHSNASQTILSINPDIVMASCSYVLSTVATHDTSPAAHAGQFSGLADHIADLANPHQVTAAQAGAELAGAVAEHDASPTAHAGQFAGLAAHLADLANPHQVTAAQSGAEAAGSVAAHNTDGEAHEDIRQAIADIVIPVASTEAAGISERATTAEVLAGADTERHVTPADMAAAISGVVRGYTRQQSPVPVARTGQSGSQAVDCHLHQLLSITAVDALALAEPEHAEVGVGVTLLLYSASPVALTWDEAYLPSAAWALPTYTLEGKWQILSFWCHKPGCLLLTGVAQES